MAYQTDSDSENVVLDKVNDNYHPGVGVPEFPVLLPLNNIPQENIMDAVKQRLAGIAKQIQNFSGQGHGDENWLKPETFHGNDDDVCQARAWIDRFVGFMELKGDLPQGQVVRYLCLVLKGPAYQWFLALNPNSTLQREAFLDRFVTANNLRYKLRHNFERHCQQPGENISTYIADMQQMGTALDLDDNTIKHAVICGLIPPLRSWVLTHEPVNLAVTIRAAKVAALAVSPDADFSANVLRKYNDKGINEIIKVIKQQHEDNVTAHAPLNKLTNMMADLMIQKPTPR